MSANKSTHPKAVVVRFLLHTTPFRIEEVLAYCAHPLFLHVYLFAHFLSNDQDDKTGPLTIIERPFHMENVLPE